MHPMHAAFIEAQAAANRGEVPVGAVIVEVDSGLIIASFGNEVLSRCDPTAHAEILALRHACMLRGRVRLPDCALYVTLEPCVMCTSAISHARLRRLVFGCYDPKGGGVEHGPRWFDQPYCRHRPEIIGGIEEHHAMMLLRRFFQDLRETKKKT